MPSGRLPLSLLPRLPAGAVFCISVITPRRYTSPTSRCTQRLRRLAAVAAILAALFGCGMAVQAGGVDILLSRGACREIKRNLRARRLGGSIRYVWGQ